MTEISMAALADQLALRRTAELYAQGADRRDKAVWTAILTEDCVIEGPGFSMAGREAALGSLDFLASSYEATQHRIHNQIATVAGNTATGETYCTADHLYRVDGAAKLLCWSIRYQDEWRREAGVWRFARRTLIVDWQETRSVDAPQEAAA